MKPAYTERLAELRAMAAVMREMGVDEAYGIKLGAPPTPKGHRPEPKTREEVEEEAEAAFLRKVKAMTGGTPSPALAEKLRRVVR